MVVETNGERSVAALSIGNPLYFDRRGRYADFSLGTLMRRLGYVSEVEARRLYLRRKQYGRALCDDAYDACAPLFRGGRGGGPLLPMWAYDADRTRNGVVFHIFDPVDWIAIVKFRGHDFPWRESPTTALAKLSASDAAALRALCLSLRHYCVNDRWIRQVETEAACLLRRVETHER